jgi:Membrane dipeptidase (Peptidase family M19)
VKGDVEKGTHAITPLVREFHARGLDCHIGYVKKGILRGKRSHKPSETRVIPFANVYGSSDARALHAAHPAIDLHADTLMWSRWIGYDLSVRHDAVLPGAAFFGHVDVPRLAEGGIGAQFFGLVSVPIAHRGNARAIDEQIDLLDAEVGRAHGRLRKVRSAEEIDRAHRDGATCALLGIEGAHALEGDLERVDHYARRGVRYLGLLHFSANEAGFPAYGSGRRDDEGLSRWGKELVERCEAASIIVDLAHLNRRGFLDACRMAKRPPIVSHTGVSSAHATSTTSSFGPWPARGASSASSSARVFSVAPGSTTSSVMSVTSSTLRARTPSPSARIGTVSSCRPPTSATPLVFPF